MTHGLPGFGDPLRVMQVLHARLVDALHALCVEHFELEETELLPFARARLDGPALERLGRSMAARRSAPYPPAFPS